MKVLTFGSCLSAYTADHLQSDFGFQRAGQVVHNRSDTFVERYVDQTGRRLPPYDKLVEALKPTTEDARWYFKNQEIETMGAHGYSHGFPTLLEQLEQPIDIILLDNFIDLAAKLVRVDHPDLGESFDVFMNTHEYDASISPFISFVDFIDADQSAENWVKIYRYLRGKQPDAKIFMLCFQYEQSRNDQRRYEVGRRFYPEMLARRPEGLTIVPPLAVPEELTKGIDHNWQHFEAPVYKALAGYVYLTTVAGLPDIGESYRLPPSFFG